LSVTHTGPDDDFPADAELAEAELSEADSDPDDDASAAAATPAPPSKHPSTTKNDTTRFIATSRTST